MVELFSNNAHGTLNAGIGAGTLSLTLDSGQGALFPNPGSGEFFRCTLERLDLTAREIIYCTARSGDTFSTIVRGQEGDTATTFSAGDRVRLRPTRGMLEVVADIIEEEVDLIPHGWAGHGAGAQSEWGVNFTHTGGTSAYSTPGNANQLASILGRTSTATGATQICGFGVGATQARVWRGDAANRGGFDNLWRFGLGADLTGMYGFFGMDEQNSFTYSGGTPEGRTAVEAVGVGFASSSGAGGNWFVYHSAGAGSVTAVDTGIPRNATDVFELRLDATPNASSIEVTFKNLATGVIFEHSVTTNMPATTTFLTSRFTTSGVIGGICKTIGYWRFNVNQSEALV